MAAIVNEYDLGVVADDFSPQKMAEAISSLSVEKIDLHKAQAHKHAFELSSEKNGELFRQIVRA